MMMMYDDSHIGAVGFRYLRGIIKSAVLSSEESPWEFWQRSMTKSDILCVYDKGNDVLVTLGEIKLVMIDNMNDLRCK